jgi:hypothetical protein
MSLQGPLAFSSDNKLITYSQQVCEFTGALGYIVMLVDIATGREVGLSSFLRAEPQMLSFIEENGRLLCYTIRGVEIWDVATCHLSRIYESSFPPLDVPERISRPHDPIVMLTHDSMIVRATRKEIEMFDLQLKVKKASLTLSGWIYRVACVPGTRKIAFAGRNGLAGIWDPWTDAVRISDVQLDHHLYALFPDGKVLCYGGVYGQIPWWHINDEDHGDFGLNK